LTGVLAGLLAQGLPAGDALILGVAIHALAGDRAARRWEKKVCWPAIFLKNYLLSYRS